MSSEAERENVTTRIKSERRFWRRVDTPQSWWPWGFVPAAGLAVLFLFGALFTAPRIEAEVRDQVASRFDGVGVVTSEVASNGQGVNIRAESLDKDTIYLRALAKSTQCDTWAGQLTCPTSVNVVVETTGAATAILTRRPHPFTVVKNGNAVTLTGEMPNLAEHDRVLGLAGQHFEIVTDELTISNEPATENDSLAAKTSLALANNLDSGQASWSGQALTVTGIAAADAVAATREQFNAFGSGSVLGEFDVQTPGAPQDCNKQFDDILSNVTVRFQTSSALIDAGNEELLQRLAELAQSCQGKLSIEGHTDSRGDAAMNKALSLARASSVRDALAQLGVDADRVTATGFGATQPVADNATADGRAKNRRIAITIDETE
jgi:outer membrane protein OmpA-like peptidoglycan-associated protein